MKFVTTTEAAKKFGVLPATVKHWCQRGLFPNARCEAGRVWLIPASDLEGFQPPRRGRPAKRKDPNDG